MKTAASPHKSATVRMVLWKNEVIPVCTFTRTFLGPSSAFFWKSLLTNTVFFEVQFLSLESAAWKHSEDCKHCVVWINKSIKLPAVHLCPLTVQPGCFCAISVTISVRVLMDFGASQSQDRSWSFSSLARRSFMLASGLSREGLILNTCVLQGVAGIILSNSRWRQRPNEFCLRTVAMLSVLPVSCHSTRGQRNLGLGSLNVSTLVSTLKDRRSSQVFKCSVTFSNFDLIAKVYRITE